MLVEKTRPTVTEDQRITPERVQRVIDEEDFELDPGDFLHQFESGRMGGCACGALAIEYGPNDDLNYSFNFNEGLSRLTGIPYPYLEGVSDGFEGVLTPATFDLPESQVNYDLGVKDGSAVRREKL